MGFLLDADWVISFLNGRPNAIELVTKLADDGIAIGAITYGEIVEGLLGVERSRDRLHEFEQLTSSVDLLPVDVPVARHYAQVRSTLRAEGRLIPDNDLWIAATALEHNLTLVSRDSHFERVPGLELLSSAPSP